MESIENMIKKYEEFLEENPEASKNERLRWAVTIIALKEKLEREKACVGCKHSGTGETKMPCRDCNRRYEDFYEEA